MTDRPSDLSIRRFTWGIIDANSYLIREGKDALLIDPVDSEELYEALGEIDHLAVVLTHCHFDHICGLNRVRELKPDVTVYASAQCSEWLGNKNRNMSNSGNAFLVFYLQKEGNDGEKLIEGDRLNVIKPFTCAPADVAFEGELTFSRNGHEVLLIPFFGHSADSIGVVLDHRYLFSGDTLLGIPTATRFLGGSTARFWEEDIPRLRELEKTIERVFPGHGDPGSISEMIAVNHRPERFRHGS